MTTVRYNEDPLLSAFTPLQNGEIISVVTSSSVLITAVPHLVTTEMISPF
jgi:sulfite reductase (NADPH) hemoprotein beta-component